MTAESLDVNSVLSEVVRDADGLRDIREARLFVLQEDEARGRSSMFSRQWLERLVVWRDGTRVDADAAALARFNACAGRAGVGECDPKPTLPIDLAVGDVVTLDLRRRTGAHLPGGHQMYRARTPADQFSPGSVDLLIRADRYLHVEGDLEPLRDGTGYRYLDRGFGFVAASTLDSWPSYAKLQSDSHSRWIEVAGDALQVLSPLAEGSAPEDILRSHWLWIRRTLDYRLAAPFLRQQALIGPAPLAEILASGYGNCDDLAMLLAALLRRDGVAAEIVAVDSEEWPLTTVPVPRTHHVIVYLPQFDRYVDPSLADRHVLPTGGRYAYPFALHLSDGRIRSVRAEQTR
jgi:hypothetical protein